MNKDAGSRDWSRKFFVSLIFLVFLQNSGLAYFGKADWEAYLPPEPEAGRWLAQKEQACFVYRGRCRGPEKADVLVKRLYQEGAVFVGLILSGDDPVGLKVFLPLEKEKREEIFSLANETLHALGFNSLSDEDQDDISIWFP